MAKIVAGILSRVSGKVAGVVGASWKGINYVRQYVIPADAQSPAQLTQRALFTACQALTSAFLGSIVNKFWDPFARKMTGYNAMIRKNLNNMTSPSDFVNSSVAEGKLEIPAIGAATYNAMTGTVEIPFSSAIFSNGLATDSIVGAVYDDANFVGFVNDTGITRVAGTITVTVGTGRVAAELNAFCFAYRGLTTPNFLVSDSTVDDTVI